MERLKNLGFILTSIFSPFGTTVIIPWPEVETEFEDLTKGPPSARVKETSGKIIVPTGSSAEITLKTGGKNLNFRIDDYRRRPGHTPGVKVTGEAGNFELDKEDSEKIIPGIVKIYYRRK